MGDDNRNKRSQILNQHIDGTMYRGQVRVGCSTRRIGLWHDEMTKLGSDRLQVHSLARPLHDTFRHNHLQKMQSLASTRLISLHIGLSCSTRSGCPRTQKVAPRACLASSNMSCVLRTLPQPSLEQAGLTRTPYSMFCHSGG